MLPVLEGYARPGNDYEDRMHSIDAIGRLGRLAHPVTRIKLLAVLENYRSDGDEDIANAAEDALARLRRRR